MGKIRLLFLYIAGFYVVYSPEIFLKFGIPSQVMIGILGIFMTFLLLSKRALSKKRSFFLSKNLQLLFLCIILNAGYLLIISMVNGYQNRLFQNIYIIIPVFVWIFLLNVYHNEKNNHNSFFQNTIHFLANIAMIQAFFCCIMLLIPSTKELALQLYYLGREENIFISGMRIYGISGDYTFFTPIYHGLLGVCLLWMALVKNSKYLIYLPFIFLVIILNGRTGLVLFFIGALMISIIQIMQAPKYIGKILFYFFIIGNFAWISLSIIKVANPSTYHWFMLMVNDIFNLFGDNIKTGNIASLSNSFILPKNLDLLFGMGTRVIGGVQSNILLPRSDIGYVNDVYLGGIVYIISQYGSVLIYILSPIKKGEGYIDAENDSDIKELSLLPVVLFILILIGNYKGELMRSGSPLIFLIVLKNVFIITERRANCEKES